MANRSNKSGSVSVSNRNNKGNADNNGSKPLESEELSAEDYAIIAAALSTLGEFFSFLSLIKAKEVINESGGQVDPETFLIIQSRKKAAKRRSRLPR